MPRIGNPPGGFCRFGKSRQGLKARFSAAKLPKNAGLLDGGGHFFRRRKRFTAAVKQTEQLFPQLVILQRLFKASLFVQRVEIYGCQKRQAVGKFVQRTFGVSAELAIPLAFTEHLRLADERGTVPCFRQFLKHSERFLIPPISQYSSESL